MERKAHYDSKTGEWTGQLGMPDLAVHLDSPPIPGTSWELQTWVNGLRIPRLDKAVLHGIVVHVHWQTGEGCYAGIDTLARELAMSPRSVKSGLAGLVSAGIITRRRRLVGTTETIINLDTTRVSRANSCPSVEANSCPSEGAGFVADRTVPFSSNNKNEQSVSSFSFEYSVMEEKGNQNQNFEKAVPTLPDRPDFDDSLAPADKPPTQDLRQLAGMDSTSAQSLQHNPPPQFYPDNPPPQFFAAYCLAMLQRYRNTWLSAWEHNTDKVVRWYSTRWPKFLEDLQRHRANELAGVGYAPGFDKAEASPLPEPPVEPMHCEQCGVMTTRPRGQFLKIGDEVVVDGCYECSPPTSPQPLKELVARR